jgi:hypothetical protein
MWCSFAYGLEFVSGELWLLVSICVSVVVVPSGDVVVLVLDEADDGAELLCDSVCECELLLPVLEDGVGTATGYG